MPGEGDAKWKQKKNEVVSASEPEKPIRETLTLVSTPPETRLGAVPFFVAAQPERTESKAMEGMDKLLDTIFKLHEDEKTVTHLLFTNVLRPHEPVVLPVPDPKNLGKIRINFRKLPKEVRDCLVNGIPKEEKRALDDIYRWLGSKEREKKARMRLTNKSVQAG